MKKVLMESFREKWSKARM